jgi:hypothetical protein
LEYTKEQLIQLAISGLTTINSGTYFTIRSLFDFNFVEELNKNDANAMKSLGKEFKRLVKEGTIHGVESVGTGSDRTEWYKKN